jgi:CelD/BcsL family acetyltransferase involved in cellulose biosynthesis
MSDVCVDGSAWADSVAAPQLGSTARRGTLAATVHEGFQAYRELEADWLRLAGLQSGAVLFQSPDLLQCWADHLAASARQRFTTVVVRDHADRVVLIWPVLVEQVGFVRIARGAGAPVCQYDEVLLDPGCDPATTWKAATDALATTVRPDLICLERVRGDSALSAALGDAAPLGAGDAAPYSDLSGGVAKFMTTLKTRVTRQQKKRVRRFEQEGAIGFEVAAGPEQTQEWLTEAIEMKRLWLRDTGRFSRAFVKPETLRCLDACACALGRPEASPRMVVARLTLDGRTAAIEMGFAHRGAYHLYLGTFAADLAKFGPGNVLTEKVLHWCAANGIDRYDMLAPRSRNKAEWQSGEILVHDYALPTTTLGRAYSWAALRHVVPATRRVFYSMPAPVRTALTGFALRNLPKPGRAA